MVVNHGGRKDKGTGVTETDNRKRPEARGWQLDEKWARPDKDATEQARGLKGPHGGH